MRGRWNRAAASVPLPNSATNAYLPRRRATVRTMAPLAEPPASPRHFCSRFEITSVSVSLLNV